MNNVIKKINKEYLFDVLENVNLDNPGQERYLARDLTLEKAQKICKKYTKAGHKVWLQGKTADKK